MLKTIIPKFLKTSKNNNNNNNNKKSETFSSGHRENKFYKKFHPTVAPTNVNILFYFKMGNINPDVFSLGNT